MINNLNVKNFKAWESLDISFGKVTGIFGTNSSGKSSLLQMLLLLKQTKNTTDRNIVLDFGDENKLINLGTYRDVIHNHNVETNLSWSLDWNTSNDIKITDPSRSSKSVLFSGNKLTTNCSTFIKDNALTVESLSYQFADNTFEIRPKKEGGTEFNLLPNHKAESGFRFSRTKGRSWALPKPIKTYLFPDQAKTYYQNADFLSVFESEYEVLMDSIYYLGPLREFPKREYQWSGSRPDGVGTRGERTVDAILAATMKKEKRNLGKRTHYKPFQEIIAYWLKKLGLIYSFKIEEIAENTNLYRTLVKKEAGASEVALTDVGFGVSQVLPVLVLLYSVPEKSIILLEQPEIHLHPSVQSQLADLIITVAKTRSIQIIVESHSEHLLRRFQRRVSEESIAPKDIKLYFFNTVRGKAKHEELLIDIFGNISNWPEHFFGDEMAEISATRTAGLMRKKKAMELNQNDD